MSLCMCAHMPVLCCNSHGVGYREYFHFNCVYMMHNILYFLHNVTITLISCVFICMFVSDFVCEFLI